MPAYAYDLERHAPLPEGTHQVETSRFASEISAAMTEFLVSERLVDGSFSGDLRKLHHAARREDIVLAPHLKQGTHEDRLNTALERFAESERFQRHYRRLVAHIATEVLGLDCVFQAAPTVRCIFPVEGLLRHLRNRDGVLLSHHSDILFGDPSGQVNCWLPLTLSKGSSSIFIAPLSPSLTVLRAFFEEHRITGELPESARDDFFTFLCNHPELLGTLQPTCQPVELPVGTTLLFDARRIHGTGDITGDETRVSIDFRLVPTPLYERRLHEEGAPAFQGKRLVRGEYYAQQTTSSLNSV